jgi:hypothetical protein
MVNNTIFLERFTDAAIKNYIDVVYLLPKIDSDERRISNKTGVGAKRL